MLGFVLDALLAALEDVAAELVLESAESVRITFDSSESVDSVESAVDSEGAGASLSVRAFTLVTLAAKGISSSVAASNAD